MEKDISKKIIDINEEKVKDHLASIVRGTVEETLNSMLDAEADAICNASKHERSPDRVDSRAGYYERGLETKAGKVTLKVPKLRKLPFETAIIQRYQRREISVEEALVEMYLAGVSVRRVEDVTQALWGSRLSTGTRSNLNPKVCKQIDEWRNRPLESHYPYVYLDGIVLKRSWGGEIKNVSVLVAIAVRTDGYREVLGAMEGQKEDKSGWSAFLAHLKERGMQKVNLFITDRCLGLVESVTEFYPESAWQRCVVHFYRNVAGRVPHDKGKAVMAMLKAVHAQEDLAAAKDKTAAVVQKLKEMKLREAALLVESAMHETLAYMNFPTEHWRRIRTNNPLERIMWEIRRRTRVVGAFPDGNSALMLTTARFRHIASSKWGSKKYLDVTDLIPGKKEANIA